MINNQLSPIEEIIEDAKAGKMFILVDDENRENEGDLVIPAQMCDAQAVNFMAKYGRGLICLSLDEKRIAELALPLMSLDNSSRYGTAFTISIESREGVSTGISAADRAKTIEVAINSKKGKNDIASPGHIFPLKAVNGGVLVRAGHTEAAVDISRIAGLNPSGVICEIMNEDGTMARLPDLAKFSQKHNLKIGAIKDLITYRLKNDILVKKTAEKTFKNKKFGEFKVITYLNKIENIEHIALVKGKISQKNCLARMHHFNITEDILGGFSGESKLDKSMKIINNNGSGLIIIIRKNEKQISHLLDKSLQKNKLINYGIGAQILLDLGAKNISLLTTSPKAIVGLDGYGINILKNIKI
jgi:3,4-dihydroxy 2-butanone 4-phosphate synthase/GTP cyclohydrolase II